MKDVEPPKPEVRKEKRIKTIYTKVPIEVKYVEMSAADIEKGQQTESLLRKDDKYAIDTADAKNRLEALVFSTREKLDTVWKPFVLPAEQDKLTNLTNEIEDWLYNEGSDEVKEAFDKKLAEIQAISDPINKRAVEWEQVPPALESLQQTLINLKVEVQQEGDKYAHIEKEELDKVLKKVEEAELWLAPLLPKHASLEKTATPVFNASDLIQRNQNVTKFCQPILSKPKPPPPAPPKEEPAPAPAPAASTPETPAAETKTDKMDTSDS